MEQEEMNWPTRRITPRALTLTIAALTVVALLAGSQLPRLAEAGGASSPIIQPLVIGAILTLQVHSVDSLTNHPNPFYTNASTCYRAANLDDLCNVTITATSYVTCPCTFEGLNYTQIGSSAWPSPTKFYFIESDPTFPVNLPSGASGYSITAGLWFHVIPSTGKISAFVELHFQ
jgi:hypothetical protein